MKVSTALLLSWRTLRTRPRRTLILLAGYGLGVAVMIALLAVGDALLLQARDRDVVLGGDLVLLPAGLDPEVLKVGAVTAMFLGIPNARFLTRQVLLGPRYAEAIAAVSPEITEKLVYVRTRDGKIYPTRASAAVPSAARQAGSSLALAEGVWEDTDEDRTWLSPRSADILETIDRFHRPPAGPRGRSWAEWWYFNFAGGDGLYGYVALIADRERRVQVGAVVRFPDGRLIRWGEAQSGTILPFAGGTFQAGPHRIDLRDGIYHIHLAGAGFSADLRVEPVPGLYVPPVEWQVGDFHSGYVVPVLRASVTGSIRAGSRTHRIEGIGYHDHNWGVWEDVTWEWGTASSSEFALLAGLLRHPAMASREMLVTLHGASGGRAGVLSILRGTVPVLSNWREGPVVKGIRLRVPGRLRYRAVNDAGDHLEVDMSVQDIVATNRPSAEGQTRRDREVFLQIRGYYQVAGTVGGRRVRFSAPGFAETFVPPGPKR